ncbi:hypothetical protein DL769_010019 [Monosporascus sp. CRB-8-3]|nr:hypothetical protein DL769_010019 [Monosporascus sp. CRB-8-3]
MDTWLSTYWKAYTEAEELQVPAVAGYYGYLDFLKAINVFSPDFSVTQMAAVEEATFKGKDPTELLLRKAQGVTAEQMSQGAFSATLNGETPSQTRPPQSAPNNNRSNTQNGNRHPNRKCLCGIVHTFKECPYICPKARPNGWTEDPEDRKKVDERIANSTEALKTTVKHASQEEKPQVSQSASTLFVVGLPTNLQANSVTTGYSAFAVSEELEAIVLEDESENENVDTEPFI